MPSINQKKIFIFSSVHRWDDTRVFHKQAVSLAKKYHVELHAPALFDYKVYKGVNIYGLTKWNKKTDRVKVHLVLFKRIINSDASIFHFHDPELLIIGLFIRLVLGKKVIYDVHEDYPKQISSADWLSKPLGKMIGFVIGIIERFSNLLLNHFIVVTKPIYKRFDRANTTIIYNFPFIQTAEMRKSSDTIQLVYIGNLREDRGIKLLCQAFRNLQEENIEQSIRLIVAGELSGSKMFNAELREIFKMKGIVYKGLLPYQEAMKIMSESHIGIIPSHYKSNYFEALPNKLFEYMQNQLLVITTDIPLWDSIVTGFDIGFTFKGESLISLINILTKCIKNRGIISEKAERAKQVAMKKFSWESEEIKLLKLYDMVLSN